jgi:hypothetical protein
MTYPARKPKKSQKTKLNQSRKRNARGEGNHIRPQKFSLAPRTPTPFLFPLTVAFVPRTVEGEKEKGWGGCGRGGEKTVGA